MTEASRLSGQPRILVVDDEDLMREVVSIMIEENGGSVIEAVNGRDAVEKFKDQGDEVDCVFLDFSMPEMNGYEAYCAIRAINSQVPVIMVSGLGVTPEVANLQNSGEIKFMSKPFHESELIAVLNDSLQRTEK